MPSMVSCGLLILVTRKMRVHEKAHRRRACPSLAFSLLPPNMFLRLYHDATDLPMAPPAPQRGMQLERVRRRGGRWPHARPLLARRVLPECRS